MRTDPFCTTQPSSREREGRAIRSFDTEGMTLTKLEANCKAWVKLMAEGEKAAKHPGFGEHVEFVLSGKAYGFAPPAE